jgi:hypothetical protein
MESEHPVNSAYRQRSVSTLRIWSLPSLCFKRNSISTSEIFEFEEEMRLPYFDAELLASQQINREQKASSKFLTKFSDEISL